MGFGVNGFVEIRCFVVWYFAWRLSFKNFGGILGSYCFIAVIGNEYEKCDEFILSLVLSVNYIGF